MENTLEVKLQSLYHLQLLDSRVDNIQAVRGELPMEINDLEDEISGLETRSEKIENEIEELKSSVKVHQESAEKAKQLIAKYEKQQDQVKNNREFVALNKEIELQKLEVMAAEKKVKSATQEIEEKKARLEEANKKLEEKKSNLKEKQKELHKIVEETEKEEDFVKKLRKDAEDKLEKRMIKAYDRIRNNVANGLAVVTIERDACGGCHSKVPPQRQLDIKQRNRIIVCENCGRILIDNDLANEINVTVTKKLEKTPG